jgi:hypothetical protein
MTQIHLRRPVPCPAALAATFTERWFSGIRTDDDAHVTLDAPVDIPGIGDASLARQALVRLVPLSSPGSMVEAYRVSWRSASDGPFPQFDGILSMPDDEDYRACFIALDGYYTPPLGAAGAVFDRVIGHRIAESTGTALLERIGAYVETAYRETEAAKASARNAVATGNGPTTA